MCEIDQQAAFDPIAQFALEQTIIETQCFFNFTSKTQQSGGTAPGQFTNPCDQSYKSFSELQFIVLLQEADNDVN